MVGGSTDINIATLIELDHHSGSTCCARSFGYRPRIAINRDFCSGGDFRKS